MRKIKFIISIIIIAIFSMNSNVYAKYTYTKTEKIVNFNIDRTAPKLEIEYIECNEYIEVVIKANEPIKSIEGWNINDENTMLTKKYYQNTEEKIIVYDLSDNAAQADINVNLLEPIKIKVIDVENTNTGYEKYANDTSTIKITYEINGVARLADRLELDDIVIKLDGSIVEDVTKELLWTLNKDTKYQYKLVLKNIIGNGMLDVEVKKDSLRIITNEVDTTNKAYNYQTGIMIDNIPPDIDTKEEQIETGHSNFTILSNEELRAREEWQNEENKLSMSKIFPSNVEYQITASDLAGNTTEVLVDVNKATYIKLIYGSHNLNYGWLFAEDRGKIAGKEAILAGGRNPIECLAFRLEGNVESDFIGVRAFVYSYWQKTLGVCNYTGNTYCFGYNPYDETWRNMKNAKLAKINEKEYFVFGGVGLNKEGQCDVNGENPINDQIAIGARYGISAIKFKLKDYSQYSIVYQIHTMWDGWIPPSYNEKENSVGYPSTISGLRVTVVPNSELQAVYDFWYKDC